MKLPIYIETQGPGNEYCGDNCAFLSSGVDGGYCIIFGEELVRKNEDVYAPVYIRCTRCGWFDEEDKQ